MNTPAINNPLGINTQPPSSKQDTASPFDAGAFNKLLTREIAGRNNSNANNNVNNSSNGTPKNTQKEGSANNEKIKDASGDNATSEVIDASKKPEQTTATNEDQKDESDADHDTVSAEMLAFVAALNQANNPSATDKSLPTDKINTALDATLGAAAESGSAAKGKNGDFTAALDKAITSENGKATATAASDIDLAAATTAKVLEPTSNPQAVATLNSAALTQLNNASSAQSAKLAPHVGSPGWDQALGQKVIWMVQGVQQSATLTLNPPDLGPLQVTLNVSNNHATANFTAQHVEVRQALEAAMPRLREMLNEAGIQLGQSNVSAGSSNQQNAYDGQPQNGRHTGFNDTSADPVVHVSHIPLPASSNGIVDTFA